MLRRRGILGSDELASCRGSEQASLEQSEGGLKADRDNIGRNHGWVLRKSPKVTTAIPYRIFIPPAVSNRALSSSVTYAAVSSAPWPPPLDPEGLLPPPTLGRPWRFRDRRRRSVSLRWPPALPALSLANNRCTSRERRSCACTTADGGVPRLT